MGNEYALAGVDPSMIRPFKETMLQVAKKTIAFPQQHGAIVEDSGIRCTRGPIEWSIAKSVLEGLGNKSWIAQWMYKYAGDGKPRAHGIAIDNAMMSVNDILVQGAMPVTFNDEVIAGNSEFFDDEVWAADFAQGTYEACKMAGMALVGGESAPYKYLVGPHKPLKNAPILSGCVSGIIAPASNWIDERRVVAGDSIVGLLSSGMHANGASLVIKRMLRKKDKFLTKLPSGMTVGDAALTATLCYVTAVKAWLRDQTVQLHKLLPGTGDGVAKLLVDPRQFTYRIHSWPTVPEFFRYFLELGVDLETCLRTFNMGIGMYAFMPAADVERAIQIATVLGYEAMEIGIVEEGERCVIFGPENDLLLAPSGN